MERKHVETNFSSCTSQLRVSETNELNFVFQKISNTSLEKLISHGPPYELMFMEKKSYTPV